MTLRPDQPQSIGGVLDTTFRLFKATVVPLLPLSAITAVLGSLPSVYLLIKGASLTGDRAHAFAAAQDGTYLAIALFAGLASLCIYAAIFGKVAAVGNGQPMSIGAALGEGMRRAPVLISISFLSMVAIVIGFVLLVVPGLILMVSLLPSFCVALLEGKRPIQSLRESHRLVWGNWWRTTAILTVGLIIAIVISLVAGILIGVVVPFLRLPRDSQGLYSLLTALGINGVIGLVLPPFYVSLLVTTYWDLKLRKEGGDLAARVGTLNAA